MKLPTLEWLKTMSYPAVKTFVKNNWKTLGGIAGLVIGGGMWALPGGSAPHISAFMATPSEMTNVADGVTLQWVAEEATEVRLNGVLMDQPKGTIQAFPEMVRSYVLVASNQFGEDRQVIQVSTKDSTPAMLTIPPKNVSKSPIQPKKQKGLGQPPDIFSGSGKKNGAQSTSPEDIQKTIARFSKIPWEQEGKSQSQILDAKNECIFAFRQKPGIRSMEECMIARNYKRRR